jgi:hypothetical protein
MKKSNNKIVLFFSISLFLPSIIYAHSSLNSGEGKKSYIIALGIVLGLMLIQYLITKIKNKE